jgi:putative MATE family efflux protein
MSNSEGTSPPHPESSALRRRVLGMAWPIIGENLLETLLGIVDTWLVAGLGAAAIAGVGTGQQMMFLVLATLSAVSIGTSILVAQSVGARDTRRASHLARQALVWSAVFSIPLAIGGVTLAPVLVAGFGLAPEVVPIATGYFRVTMGTVVVVVALVIGGGVMRGAGDPRTPMRVTAVANVVNAALAYSLVYGQFGLPRLGAVGSAWATFLARALALALLLRALHQGRNGVCIAGAADWTPRWATARSVLKLGVPAALEQILISTAFLFLTTQVARLGTETLAAQRISMSALSFSFMPGIGFSIAATTLVGQCVGARRPWEGAGVARVAATWAVVWMGAIGVLVFAFAEPLMRAFTTDSAVIRIGAAGLRVVALTQPAWAIGMVHSGGVRGTGDTRFPLVVSATGVWTAVLLATLFIAMTHGGLAAVWSAFMCTSPVTAVVLVRRFRHRIHSLDPASQPPPANGETSPSSRCLSSPGPRK